jgi:DNA-3-methyladenine glycosylase I
MLKRCAWTGSDPLYVEYHDQEWGVPSYDGRHLFEMLILEGAQAGLSWITILRKRAGYQAAFRGFDPERVAEMGPADVDRLVQDASIVRHRGKIEAAIHNARMVLEVQASEGDFASFLWAQVGGKPVRNRWGSIDDLPSETDESKGMSKELKRRGFKFVGPTTCYAFMQAVGMVNDHETGCFRYDEI